MDGNSRAAELKEQGNAMLTLRTSDGYRNAVLLYDLGLAEDISDDKIRIALHNNRAQAHLMLQNYGHVISDAKAVLRSDSKDMKACWRGAKAAVALRKHAEVLYFAQLGAKLSEGEVKKQFVEWAHTATDAMKERTTQALAQDAETKLRSQLMVELNRRQITIGPGEINPKLAVDGEKKLSFEVNADGSLGVPCYLLFDEERVESRVLHRVWESDCIGDVVASTLPYPWDPQQQRYSRETIDVLYLTRFGGYERVNPHLSFRELWTRSEFFLQEGACVLHVVPEGHELHEQGPLFEDRFERYQQEHKTGYK
jgi:hypothetical protein